MSLNAKKILAPKLAATDRCVVVAVHTESGVKILKNAAVFTINLNGEELTLTSPCSGRVNQIFARAGVKLTPKALLALIESFDVPEYRPAQDEVNPDTELGHLGRRGIEREGQREFGNGNENPLFEAPEKGQGQGQSSSVQQNPLTQNMKEGVPPKMNASAAQNQTAVDHMAEEASKDPQLQMQLSQQLQAQLNVTPSHTTAPTASPTR